MNVAGLGAALSFTPSVGHVALYFEKRKILAVGITTAGAGVGSFMSAPLITFLLDEYGLRGTFLIVGGVVLNLCVCGSLYRPLSYYDSRIRNREDVPSPRQAADYHSDTITFHPDQSNKCQSGLVNEGFTVHESTEVVNFEVSLKAIPLESRPCQKHSDIELDNTVTSSTQTADTSTTGPRKSQSTGTHTTKSFDWGLLKRPDYLLIGITLMLMIMGFFNMVTVLLPVHSASLGIENDTYALFISIMGALDTCGRIFFGWFADLNLITKGTLMSVFMFISSVLIMLVPAVGASEVGIGLIAALFGITGAVMAPMQTGVLVERVGPEKLQSAISLSRMFVGIPFLFSQPVAGEYKDLYKPVYVHVVIRGI